MYTLGPLTLDYTHYTTMSLAQFHSRALDRLGHPLIDCLRTLLCKLRSDCLLKLWEAKSRFLGKKDTSFLSGSVNTHTDDETRRDTTRTRI